MLQYIIVLITWYVNHTVQYWHSRQYRHTVQYWHQYTLRKYCTVLTSVVDQFALPKAQSFVTKEAPPPSCQAHCTKKTLHQPSDAQIWICMKQSSSLTNWRRDINCPLRRPAICDEKDERWPKTRTRGTPPTIIPPKGRSRENPKLSQKEKCGFAHGPLNIAGIGHSLTDWGFVRNIAANMTKKNKGCLLPVVLLT